MAYSAKVNDHYNNPRNIGSFAKDEENVGTGMVGAPRVRRRDETSGQGRGRSDRRREIQDLWLW